MTAQAKLIGALISTVLLTIAVMWGAGYIKRLQDKAALSDMRETTLANTSAQIADNDTAATETSRVEIVVSDSRAKYSAQLEEVYRNEPTTRARADRPVPDSLRNLARERRLNRERSGRPSVGSEGEREAAPAAKR